MRVAYLDCFSGIRGDMFLGALVDAGVSAKLLEDTVAALDIGARLEISRVVRGGISATKVDVYSNGEKDLPREVFWEQQGRDHAHEHAHHDQDEAVWRGGSAPPRTGQSPVPTQHGYNGAHARGLNEIRRIIEKATISSTAKATAIRIFETLGEAEAEIHNTSVEQVHFHEVGAVDAMVDIVCAAVGAESLGVQEWGCSLVCAGTQGRAGAPPRRGDRKDAEPPVRVFSRHEDRESGIRRWNARFPRPPEPVAANHRRSCAVGRSEYFAKHIK